MKKTDNLSVGNIKIESLNVKGTFNSKEIKGVGLMSGQNFMY